MRRAPFDLRHPSGKAYHVYTAPIAKPTQHGDDAVILPNRFDVGILITRGWRFA